VQSSVCHSVAFLYEGVGLICSKYGSFVFLGRFGVKPSLIKKVAVGGGEACSLRVRARKDYLSAVRYT
jgi:hypothetical protein